MLHQRSFRNAGTVRTRAVLGAILMYVAGLPATAQQQETPIITHPVTITSGPPITGTLTIAPTVAQPAMTPSISPWSPARVPSGPGTMLCNDAGLTGACGNTDADYVGAYKLNMKCDQGFYDPIYGGSCWSCPANDPSGNNWIRSANAVTDDDACWRVPKEKTTSATFDKLGWAWDCSGSEFWDEHDKNGNWIFWGGACWSCPEEYPRRTAYAVTASNACATPVNQTSPAELLKYNGCPTPDETTMYPNKSLSDKRTPGNPFLDIASGISVAQNAGGACWACPVVDTPGDFLVAQRNANTLIGKKTGNNGCMIQYKYKPPVFPEPGLSGLAGVKEVLFEKQIFTRPNDLTKYMYGLAAAANLSGSAAQQYVAQQWADIAQHPYMNSVIRALLLQYMGDKAPANMYPNGQVPTSPTTAETTLVNSFQTYIQLRRTYLAQQGLHMYDAWYNSTQQYNQSHAQNLGTLFYYGTVPPDFQSMLASIGAVSAAGLGTIGAVAAAETFVNSVKVAQSTTGGAVRTTTLFGMQGLKFFSAGMSTVGALGGALVIEAVGAILSSIAIDQLTEILTARDKLVAGVTAAQQPVNLSSLSADQALYFWGLATSVNSELEDGQIVAMAQAANNAAKQNNYAQPK